MSVINATQFLTNRARVPQEADTPETRLMQALTRLKTVRLTDIPSITGPPADRALVMVEQLRDAGRVVVMRPPDGTAMHLGLN